MSQGGILNYVASTPVIPTSFDTDAGTAIPVANLLQILGGEGIDTSAAGNIITITGELATAAANVGLANIGVCAFDSADFAVVNGFVSIAATFGGFQSILTDSGLPAVLPDGTGLVTFIGGANITTTGGINTVTFDATDVVVTGDTGFVTGPAISLLGNTGSANCGASVSFNAASATELDLIVTDGNFNTLIGKYSGNATVSSSGLNNTALGYAALLHAGAALSNTAIGSGSLVTSTTGSLNTSIGTNALQHLITGDSNISIGANSSDNYTSSEDSNIIIGNPGTIGESHVIRIGTQGNSGGKQDQCFIAGITGITTANSAAVTINTVTGQLGASTASPITWSNINANQTLVVNTGVNCTGGAALSLALPAVSAVGNIIRIVLDGSTSWTITQAANQQIRVGTLTTTLGVGGSVNSLAQGDFIELVCKTADLVWTAIGFTGLNVV